MEYLLMCCIDERQWDALSPERRDEVMTRYQQWVAELEAAGQHRDTQRLQPTAMSTTLRHDGGQLSVTDGPFAETKEQFGGYHRLECANLDEALAIAARIPTLTVGGVIEVRPLRED